MGKSPSSPWLLGLNQQVWILALGRFLSQIGTGFTLFYAPIFFVNQVGLSATQVGLAIGCSSISGVFGRFAGGSLTDDPRFGRKKILLCSAVVSAIASGILASTHHFSMLVLGNLFMGLGIGLYWPAAEAAVADLTTPDQRSEAFAINRLADNMGLGFGVIMGGAIIATSANYRLLFIIDGLSFVVFFVVVLVAIADHFQLHEKVHSMQQSWLIALSDRRLLIYLGVNILFTTYLAQIQSTASLYLTNFAHIPPHIISALFTWHIIFASVCQLPMARWLKRFKRTQALSISFLLWATGFSLMWLTIQMGNYGQWLAILSLGILSFAMISYTPSASALVADLAPDSLRGIYLALNSQCWAIGYLIGPPLGGFALDHPPAIAASFWLILAFSIIPGLFGLRWLDLVIQKTIIKEK